MTSGVGFTNIDEENQGKPRKRTVSAALLVTFMVLLLVIASFGALKWWHKNLRTQSTVLDQEIEGVHNTINERLTGDVSDFSVRLQVMSDGLYQGYDTNDLFQEIENIMVPRVVLKSFQHESGAGDKKTASNKSGASTGKNSITLTADADTFDVMAQQIDMFKKSDYFENVTVGATDRDDAGRIIFTLTMGVKNAKKTPYDRAADTTTQAEVFSEDVTVTTSESAVNVETTQE